LDFAVLGFAALPLETLALVALALGIISVAIVGWEGALHYPGYVWHLESISGRGSIVAADMPNLRGSEGFGNVVTRAALDGLHRVLHSAVARDDNRDDVRVTLHRGFDNGGAVDAGKPQVGDDDVEREIGQLRERDLARLGLFNPVAMIGQLLRDSVP